MKIFGQTVAIVFLSVLMMQAQAGVFNGDAHIMDEAEASRDLAEQTHHTAHPGFFLMGIDILAARPLGLLATAAGTVLFTASLPFSYLGGNVAEAGEALVMTPMRLTFRRPLGGTKISMHDEFYQDAFDS